MVWEIENHDCILSDFDDRSLTVFWYRHLSSRLSLLRFNTLGNFVCLFFKKPWKEQNCFTFVPSENTNPSLSRDRACQGGLGSWPCTWASLKPSFSGRKVQQVWQRKHSAKLTDHPAWSGEMKSEWDSYLLVITGGSLFIPKWLNLNECFWVKFRTFSVIWISLICKFSHKTLAKGPQTWEGSYS